MFSLLMPDWNGAEHSSVASRTPGAQNPLQRMWGALHEGRQARPLRGSLAAGPVFQWLIGPQARSDLHAAVA